MTEVYITKWSSSDGRIVKMVVNDPVPESGRFYTHFIGFTVGKDLFLTEAEATAAARKAIENRYASLQRQIEKLLKVKPYIKETA